MLHYATLMLGYYFSPEFEAPLPFYVEGNYNEVRLLSILECAGQGSLEPGNGIIYGPNFSSYVLRGTALDAVPNPAANAELVRLGVPSAPIHGPLVVVYDKGTEPLRLKPYLSYGNLVHRRVFEVWASLIAVSMATDAPEHRASAYWDFLLDEEIDEYPTTSTESFVVLAGSMPRFRHLFCDVAQPAIDRVFSAGLRSPDAPNIG